MNLNTAAYPCLLSTILLIKYSGYYNFSQYNLVVASPLYG